MHCAAPAAGDEDGASQGMGRWGGPGSAEGQRLAGTYAGNPKSSAGQATHPGKTLGSQTGVQGPEPKAAAPLSSRAD